MKRFINRLKKLFHVKHKPPVVRQVRVTTTQNSINVEAYSHTDYKDRS